MPVITDYAKIMYLLGKQRELLDNVGLPLQQNYLCYRTSL